MSTVSRIRVDGQEFEIRRSGARYEFNWLNGKNPGYGFTSTLSRDVQLSEDQLRSAVEGFLSDIDEEMGYLRD